MAQNISWLVSDCVRAKALIQDKLYSLKNKLRLYLDEANGLTVHADKIIALCGTLADTYQEYLHLLDNKIETAAPVAPLGSYRAEHFNLILNLEQTCSQMIVLEERTRLIREIISLYRVIKPANTPKPTNEHSELLKQIFCAYDLESWLSGLIDFWGQFELTSALFHDWSIAQQQMAVDFFSETKFVALVNAIFFYKLNPDKLFAQVTHPDKLISVRARLGVLHYCIESLQQQLTYLAAYNNLNSGIDQLFHGDELPQGVMIDADEEHRKVILSAIKKLTMKVRLPPTQQAPFERISDLFRAYKFWFNPNRLIDVVMLLQQSLVSPTVKNKELLFQQAMVLLFARLPTTECMDLYGYFTNKDSSYFLYTFFAITQNNSFDWLPQLTEEEHTTVGDVFQAVCTVMEALRIELKNRQVTTAPYVYNLKKQNPYIGHRNRDAVFRAIAIYSRQTATHSDAIEQLFQLIEEA